MNTNLDNLKNEAISLLKSLIKTPSFSGKETGTAALIEDWFREQDIKFDRKDNNIWAFNVFFDPNKPNLLLNSHHDTVKPNQGYTIDPFDAIEKDTKLFGLGSNDAGGCLVALLATFAYFYNRKELPYNLIMVASAEEESSGSNGLNSVLPYLPTIDCAIVGEPTEMQLAIAEKGLLVLDVIVHGTAGHAAHPNLNNPIYKAVSVINWFQTFEFERTASLLGAVKMTVTQINAGKQHNVVPSECHLVVDIRVNDQYQNEEILHIIKQNINAEINPRSLHLNASSISKNHPLVQAGIQLGRKTYGSPTLSDQSVLNCQSMKLGPGNSLRSHTANEFIFLDEINQGIDLYIQLLAAFFNLTH